MPNMLEMDAPAIRPGQQDGGQGSLFPLPSPEPFTPHDDHLSLGEDDEDFDWFANESIIVDTQEAVAVYTNPKGHTVIRRERREYERDDMFIVLSTPEAVRALIASLQQQLKEWRR